jgi:hypothetical protein
VYTQHTNHRPCRNNPVGTHGHGLHMIYHGLDAWSTVYLSEAVVSHLWITRRVELHKISLFDTTDMWKLPSSKMWRRTVWHKFTVVSEERPTSRHKKN